VNKKTVWSIIALVGAYIMCQLIADIGATKFVLVGPYVLPAGTFIFAVTFTLRDMVHKRLGKEWARGAIVMAAAFNLLLSAYLWLMTKLPAPGFFGLAESWDAIFAIVPSITMASIIAELISELVDTEVYHLWKTKLPKAPQWSRVLVSNVVSLPLDSFIFATLAFVLLPPFLGGHAEPFGVALTLTVGQTIWKGIVTVVSMPGIYLVKEKPLV
jgi:uncharacterized integral membrane protein (TIGR00697 family)